MTEAPRAPTYAVHVVAEGKKLRRRGQVLVMVVEPVILQREVQKARRQHIAKSSDRRPHQRLPTTTATKG